MSKRFALVAVLAVLVAVGVVITAVRLSGSPDDDTSASFTDGRTAAGSEDPSAIDVLVLVPDSSHAEADQELITEAIGMWQTGIDSLADEPDLGWLRDAEFEITADALGDEPTYSLLDPEIVIVAATPPGAAAAAVGRLEVYDTDDALCDTVDDPFAFDTWTVRKGFASHHDQPEGIYVEDCGGQGGNVCFAINATINPAAGMSEVFDMFSLVSDEFGHCLVRSGGLAPG